MTKYVTIYLYIFSRNILWNEIHVQMINDNKNIVISRQNMLIYDRNIYMVFYVNAVAIQGHMMALVTTE